MMINTDECFCPDCKHCECEFRLFCDFDSKDERYLSEQFDFHCRKHNIFFLEDETPEVECNKCYESAEYNSQYHQICSEYYRFQEQYHKIYDKFRKELDRKDNDEIIINGTKREYNLWVEYLKENYPEIYKELRNYVR